MTMRATQSRNGASDMMMMPAFGSLEELSKMTQGQMAAFTAMPRALAEANLTMISELFGFLGRRMKAQADLCHELGQCQELSQAIEAQRRFGAKATTDYSEELEQMSTLLRKEFSGVAGVASDAVQAVAPAPKLAA